jgi:hypothetical protein
VRRTKTYHYSDHFQEAQPIFHLAIDPDRNDVQTNQQGEENNTQSPSRKVVGPVLQQQLQGNKICSRRNGIVEPVVPGQSEAERFIDISSEKIIVSSVQLDIESTCSPSKSTERSGHWCESGHFSKSQHRHENDCTDDSVRYQHRRRTARSKTLSSTQEQTSSDRAAYGYHTYLARRQLPRQVLRKSIWTW